MVNDEELATRLVEERKERTSSKCEGSGGAIAKRWEWEKRTRDERKLLNTLTWGPPVATTAVLYVGEQWLLCYCNYCVDGCVRAQWHQ
jgi:hypothetical protein